jgi:hypothetical protein
VSYDQDEMIKINCRIGNQLSNEDFTSDPVVIASDIMSRLERDKGYANR